MSSENTEQVPDAYSPEVPEWWDAWSKVMYYAPEMQPIFRPAGKYEDQGYTARITLAALLRRQHPSLTWEAWRDTLTVGSVPKFGAVFQAQSSEQQAAIANLYALAQPGKATMGGGGTQIIGSTTTYLAASPPLRVRIIGVLKGGAARLVGCTYFDRDDDISRVGGVTADDLVRVGHWEDKRQRFSMATKDYRATDLSCFAPALTGQR